MVVGLNITRICNGILSNPTYFWASLQISLSFFHISEIRNYYHLCICFYPYFSTTRQRFVWTIHNLTLSKYLYLMSIGITLVCLHSNHRLSFVILVIRFNNVLVYMYIFFNYLNKSFKDFCPKSVLSHHLSM